MDDDARTRNRYERRELGPGLAVWVYEYANPAPTLYRGTAGAVEVAVQVRGHWSQRGTQGHVGRFGPGELHGLNASESFDASFAAPGRVTGLQVGFAIDAQRWPELAGLEIRLPTHLAPPGRRFVDWARTVTEVGALARDGVGRAEIRRMVAPWLRPRSTDPVAVVKASIERDFAAPLYAKHLAEKVGLHPETLTRRFRRRHGLTPIAYRHQCRLARASTLTWSEPETSLREIGERCGFDDESYFYRAFRAQFGTTPAVYGRREGAVTRAAA